MIFVKSETNENTNRWEVVEEEEEEEKVNFQSKVTGNSNNKLIYINFTGHLLVVVDWCQKVGDLTVDNLWMVDKWVMATFW